MDGKRKPGGVESLPGMYYNYCFVKTNLTGTKPKFGIS